MVQNAKPNKMPPNGLLIVKMSVTRVTKKEGEEPREELNIFRYKVTNWLRKYTKGIVTMTQYFSFPNRWE